MGLARELEKRLERLVDGVSGAIFRGRVLPVDLGTRLIREADLAMRDGAAGPIVPNRFTIWLHPDDLAADDGALRLDAELEYTLEATAAARGWRLEGPPEVTVVADPALRHNQLHLDAAVVPGELSPWGQLIGGAGRHADLVHNRVLLGRAEDCDVRIPDAEVSRHHAIIYREQNRNWITDLDSSNGTKVDGAAVISTVALRPGARLTLGPATFMFRLVES